MTTRAAYPPGYRQLGPSVEAQVAATAKGDAAADAVRFTVAIFIVSLLLNRFAIPLGAGLQLGIVGPIGLLMGIFWLWRGALVLDQRRIIALFVLTGAGLLGSALSLSLAITRLPPISWPSLSQFLVLTCFAALSFREKVEEERFFRPINTCLGVVGVAGILQFLLQFAGLSLFTFNDLLPSSILWPLEAYNNQIPAYIGASFYKANGFILVEPSVYSQYMALGIAIEIVFFRRPIFLAIFSLSLVLSVSGTGWMVLGGFVAGAVAKMGIRGVMIGVGTVLCGAVGLGVLAIVQPEVFAFLVSRIDEFSSPGSSGHHRFITPWWAFSDVTAEAPWAVFVGLGPGTAEKLPLSYLYGMSTPLKVLIEFGLPALVAYCMLLLAANRTQRQGALLLPALVMFLFTGTYVQFAPIVFTTLMITTVARLKPAGAPPDPR